MSNGTSIPLDDPRLLPFLPMLYVAWADGDLSDEEVWRICGRVAATEGLEGTCRELLGRWLDPTHPPSAEELRRLLAMIRGQAAQLAEAGELTLAELGLELARQGGHPPSKAERQALVEVEKALGIAGDVLVHRLLPRPITPEPPSGPPTFDPVALALLLDGDQRATRHAVRELFREPIFQLRHGLSKEDHRERVLAQCRELAARGFGALAYPTAHGGRGDLAASIAAAETLGHGDLSLFVKFGVQFGLFGGSILQLGTEKHHARYLERAGSLELPGCFAMTETGHGSNVGELETVARYDRERGELEIHTPHDGARKDYIGNAACHGRLATVFAQLEIDGETEGYGVHAILVPIRGEDGRPLPGVSIEDCGEKLGLNGVDNGRLSFDRVRVPRENLLDRHAQIDADGTYHSPIASPGKRFFTMLGTLVGGRVTVAAVSLSAAKSALAIAVRYGARRRQFGAPGRAETVLLDYPSHQRRLLPRLTATYALHFALRHLSRLYVESPAEDRREVETLAAGLKAVATWHATDTLQACREACGGAGYLAVNRFADLKADTDVFTTFEGDNTVLLQLVAKSLLTGYRQQFVGMSVLGLMRYVSERAGHAFTELNPLTGRLSADQLRGAEIQLEAMRWREEHLLSSLARRLKKRLDAGRDSFHAIVECQNHLITTARAHIERIVLERFVAAVETVDDDALRSVLDRLRQLYGAERLEHGREWFLEHGYLDRGSAKTLRKVVSGLCAELRPDAVALVDAFAIPDEVLAPIAF